MAAQQDWFDKDFYKVLGVTDDASAKEITKAYRALARKYHPDANPDDAQAEERFKEISAAYDVVGDEDRRKEYDQVRRLGPLGGGFGGGMPGGGQGGMPFDVGDLGDLFGMFGRGGRRGGGGRPRPRVGDDLVTDLHLSFEDAAHGVTVPVHLTTEAACSTCGGNGASPGSRPVTCNRCGGRGVLDDDQGPFSFSRPCHECGGRGDVVNHPCASCAGRGTERRPRTVKVRIPAGVKNGQRIRLKGKGGAGSNGGPAGDLFVEVDVGRHEVFGRKGRHLTIGVPITFAEAALGARVTVPTLASEPVTLKIPAGTPTGKTFRVKGKGMDTAKGLGDLLVTVNVDVPTDLSGAERDAIEALAEASAGSPRDYLGTEVS